MLTASAAIAMATLSAEVPAHKLSEWEFGETAFGDAVDMEKNQGKVVVLEYWGVRCPPCIASLPHLAKLHDRYKDDGLVIIGAESQGSSEKQIEPIIKKANVDYTITKGCQGPITVKGIPRILVFNRTGTMIFDGRPSDKDFERTVKKALKESAPSAPPTPEKKPSLLIEQQSWTNIDGNTIKAAVKAADSSTVTFIMANGKSVDYPLEKLSEQSREIIKEAASKDN